MFLNENLGDRYINTDLTFLLAQMPIEPFVEVAAQKLGMISNLSIRDVRYEEASLYSKFWDMFRGESGLPPKDPSYKMWYDIYKEIRKAHPELFNGYIPEVVIAYNDSQIYLNDFSVFDGSNKPVNIIDLLVPGIKSLTLRQKNNPNARLDLTDFKNIRSVAKKLQNGGILNKVFLWGDDEPFKVRFSTTLPNGATIQRSGNCELHLHYDKTILDVNFSYEGNSIRQEAWVKLGGKA